MSSTSHTSNFSGSQGALWEATHVGFSPFTFSLRFLMIAMAFLNNIDIARVDRSANEGFTPQALMKVGLILLATLLGLWGWWKSPDVRKMLLSLPGILFICLGIWYFVTIPSSIVANLSFSAAVLFWGALLFTVTCIRFVGGTKVMLDICIGQFLFLFFSCILYLVNRDLAMFTEILSATNQVERFGGLGHPNVVGRISVFLGLLLIAGAIQKSISWNWFFLSLPMIAVVCVASLSRTPIIAGALAIALVSLPSLTKPHVIYMAGFGCLAAIVLFVSAELLIGSDSLFSSLVQAGTKTGSVEEVTTMTGRTAIWQFTIEKILERPIFGWGAGSTPVLMVNVAGHAHNILLQPTVSMGIPAGLFFALILIWNVYCSFKFNLPLLRMCTTFILTLGIAETPLFNPLPESVSLMWFTVSFWPVGQQFDQTVKTTYRWLQSAPVASGTA